MRRPRGTKKIKPSLDVLPFSPPRGEFGDTECPNCGENLTVIQPDMELPDRLIGACAHCKHWFLIDRIPDAVAGTMLRLPEIQVIRKLSEGSKPDGVPVSDGGRAENPTGQTAGGDAQA